jgi:hypothetical protein
MQGVLTQFGGGAATLTFLSPTPPASYAVVWSLCLGPPAAEADRTSVTARTTNDTGTNAVAARCPRGRECLSWEEARDARRTTQSSAGFAAVDW